MPAPKRESPPAFTTDAREIQLANLAYDLIEQRIRDGTATSQEVTYALRLGNERTKLQLDLLRAQSELAIAKAEALRSNEKTEEMYLQAIEAMKRYSGHEDEEYYEA